MHTCVCVCVSTSQAAEHIHLFLSSKYPRETVIVHKRLIYVNKSIFEKKHL